MAVGSEGARVALNKFTFKDGDDSEFDEAYEKLINEILEQLTVALANIGKWEAMKEMASESLAQAMVGLEISKIETPFLEIDVEKGGTKVEVSFKQKDAEYEVYH